MLPVGCCVWLVCLVARTSCCCCCCTLVRVLMRWLLVLVWRRLLVHLLPLDCFQVDVPLTLAGKADQVLLRGWVVELQSWQSAQHGQQTQISKL